VHWKSGRGRECPRVTRLDSIRIHWCADNETCLQETEKLEQAEKEHLQVEVQSAEQPQPAKKHKNKKKQRCKSGGTSLAQVPLPQVLQISDTMEVEKQAADSNELEELDERETAPCGYLYERPWIMLDAEARRNSQEYWQVIVDVFGRWCAEVTIALLEDYGEQYLEQSASAQADVTGDASGEEYLVSAKEDGHCRVRCGVLLNCHSRFFLPGMIPS